MPSAAVKSDASSVAKKMVLTPYLKQENIDENNIKV